MSLRKLRTALSFNSKSNSEPSPSTDAADPKSQTQNVSSKFNVKGLLGTLDPVVGFQMTLIPSQKDDDIATNDKRKVPASSAPAVPELQVRVIGARHLPSLFGLKTVQGYVIKVRPAAYYILMIIFTELLVVVYHVFRSNYSRVPRASIPPYKHHRGQRLTRRSSSR